MKLFKSWLLPATCTIILVVTTYATVTQATKQKQAEVNLQQAAVSPSRLFKYGDKTTKKIPNEEVLLFPTTSNYDIINKNFANITVPVEKQHYSRNRHRARVEPKDLSTHQTSVEISRRYDNKSQAQPEIPIVHKKRKLSPKPTTVTVGQQRTVTSNRSRSKNTVTQTQQQQQLQLQPTQNSNLNIELEKTIGKTETIAAAKTPSKSRQRIPTTTSHALSDTIPSANAYQTLLSSPNSNIRSHHVTGSNSTIVRHYHSHQRNRNNNNINNNSQPLLTSNAVDTSGLQSKTESSSYKQTGNNISNNHSVSSSRTNNTSIRTNARKFTSIASTIPIISSTSTPTTTTIVRPVFQFPSTFNIFTPEFWQFLNPTSTSTPRIQARIPAIKTTRKPPKKYKPQTQISNKEEKLSLLKPKTTQQPEFSTHYNEKNNAPKKDEGPFRIALPTLNILSSKRETHDETEKGKRNVEKEDVILRERFNCPRESEVRFQLFPKICKIDEDCKVWNREEICCDIFGAKSCVSGIPKPLEETSHAPILGVIPRKCPSRPLAELWWEVKECETDMDCWPRVCCPDGRRRYCRTSQPELNTVPVPVQRSFNYLSEYLECTPPPPPIFDLHPKPCTSTLDCFPNVCCQEAGLRHCRPPKKSVLTMLANVFNVDFVKRLTQNIVIK